MTDIDLYSKRDLWLNLPEDTTWEGFCDVLDNLGTANKKIQWLIGDALLFCEGKWGDKIEDAKRRTGMSGGTLSNFLVVSRAFPNTRRRVELSWNHHYEALRAKPEQRDSVLKKAAEWGWSTRDMRLALSEHGGEEKEKGEKIGFLPLEWALQIKRWLATQPPVEEWEADNLLALKMRFDKDIMPIYQSICGAIAKVKE